MYTIDTKGIELDLAVGRYQLNFSDFFTPNNSDKLHIELLEGKATYNFGDGWQRWKTPLELDPQNLPTEFKIRIRSAQATFFTKTTEGWDAPNDKELNNPLVQLDYESLLPEAITFPLEDLDYMGSAVLRDYCTELRTDQSELSVEQLEQDFFNGTVSLSQYGVSGSAGLWSTKPGTHRVTFEMRGDYDLATLLFWNGEELIEIDPAHVSNSQVSIYVHALSEEWGFVLLDSQDNGDDTDLRISEIEWLGKFRIKDSYLANIQGITPTDSIGNATIDGDAVTLSTGNYDRAASSLGGWAMGDKEFLKTYGTEGTAVTFTDLATGVYSFDWSMYSRDREGYDSLYAWNGRELVKIGERASGEQISSARWVHEDKQATVDVIYDYVTIIALDEVNTHGTTDFTIENFHYSRELTYAPPQPVALNPDIQLGDINLKSGYTGIATGTGDRAISTIGEQLTGNRDGLRNLGVEGSYATWNLANGVYEVTWSLYTSEDELDRDGIYRWNNGKAELLAARSDAEIQSSSTRWISQRQTTTFEVTDNQLTFLAVDTVDTNGTTELRIYNIEKTSHQDPSFDPITGHRAEPPDPVPDNNWDMGNSSEQAFNLGILKPWETDDMTGLSWLHGYVFPTYHLGASEITEKIGADDTDDWAKFTLSEASYLNLFAPSNATTELLDSNGIVLGSRDESSDSQLQAHLQPGDYWLHFSADSALETVFSAQIYLSNSDPNYAD